MRRDVEARISSTMDSHAFVELNEPFGFRNYSEDLVPDSEILNTAQQLKADLEEIFGQHQLRKIPKIRVYIRILQHDSARRVPFCWKIEVNEGNFAFDMRNVGTYENNFVIWGPKVEFEHNGVYQLYIVLGGLKAPFQMQALESSGLTYRIAGFLGMKLCHPELFNTRENQNEFMKMKLQLMVWCPGGALPQIHIDKS